MNSFKYYVGVNYICTIKEKGSFMFLKRMAVSGKESDDCELERLFLITE